MEDDKKMNVLDLFSGIGGFSLGLERAGMKTVAFCEIDKKCHKVLQKHWADVPIFDNVSTLKGENIEQTIDVICGGFPCQDISLAGKGEGLAGKRSGLWSEFRRLIEEIQPKYAIIENVSALRSRGLDQVLREISEIGYDAEWNCIPASAVGAPHRRDRIWIVAYPRRGSWREQSARHSKSFGRGSLEQTEWSAHTNKTTGSSAGTTTLAHPDDSGNGTLRNDNYIERSETVEGREKHPFNRSSGSSEALAHSDDTGSQGWLYRGAYEKRESELGYLGRCSTAYGQPIEEQWAIEPDVGRVAHGVPNRVDRLKQLGNAIVPQIAELIGLFIQERERCQRG